MKGYIRRLLQSDEIKKLDFKEIWKAPFHSNGLYILSSNNVRAVSNLSGRKGEEILSNIVKR